MYLENRIKNDLASISRGIEREGEGRHLEERNQRMFYRKQISNKRTAKQDREDLVWAKLRFQMD